MVDAHEASADAVASARIAQAILASDERLSSLDSAGLLSLQRRWAREQAASLQTYLRQRNPDAYVCPEWPVQSRNLTRAEL
jgi:DNA polymerase-3 subunit epsilon